MLLMIRQADSISFLLFRVSTRAKRDQMFHIFKKKKDAQGQAQGGQLQDVQLRPVEQAGAEPLDHRLERSRSQFGQKLRGLLNTHPALDEDLLEELETTLLTADVGVKATLEIISNLRAAISNKTITDPASLLPAVQAELYELIEPCEQFLVIDESAKPFVILMVGVNGAGKTTTIGKMAQRFKQDGLSVMLAAGDTFRAAAVEQLQSWGQRNDVPVIAQASGADSAAVLFDALQSAKARGTDVLIADTAGRLHTQSNLMEELKKIRRVLSRVDETAPHEVMLVVDAGNGQNALNQAQQFNDAVSLTGITITKLDGTARGGVLFAIAGELGIPIRFIGVGESASDLRPFDAGSFIHAILPVE
jgi:fused signal recognition particle receptor